MKQRPLQPEWLSRDPEKAARRPEPSKEAILTGALDGMRASSAQAVHSLFEPLSVEDQRRVSFAEALLICPRLAAEKESAIEEAKRFKLLRFQTEEEAYRKQFDAVTFSHADIEALKDEKSVVLFTPRFETFQEALEVLVRRPGIPLWDEAVGVRHPEQVRGVSPADFADGELKMLRTMPTSRRKTELTSAVFREAYRKAEGKPYSPASVYIVSGEKEGIHQGFSALDALDAAGEGGVCLNGAAFLLFVRRMLDEGLARANHKGYDELLAAFIAEGNFAGSMPAQESATLCPTDIFPDGNVLFINWLDSIKSLNCNVTGPVTTNKFLSVRPARGATAVS